MANTAPDTDQLLDRAAAGDRAAREQLLERHRKKLKRMVAVRPDRRQARRSPMTVFMGAGSGPPPSIPRGA